MRNKPTTNEIGQRGEHLFHALITKTFDRNHPIFQPQFLGDKWPTVDFIVELVDAGEITPFFFVQVKTTREGYTKRANRLKVQLDRKEMHRLASYPAPTYIVGIDEMEDTGYILSANGERVESLSSFPTDYPINRINQDLLYEEVRAFWAQAKMHTLVSRFVDPQWRNYETESVLD